MFVRLVYESFRRQKRRKLLAGVAIALGAGVATAMIGVATDVGDKISLEAAQKSRKPSRDSPGRHAGFGNRWREPEAAVGWRFSERSGFAQIKSTFWRNAILGFAPMLPVSVRLGGANDSQDVTLLGTYFSKPYSYGKDNLLLGVRTTSGSWRVVGDWPTDDSQNVLLVNGSQLKLGKTRRYGHDCRTTARRLGHSFHPAGSRTIRSWLPRGGPANPWQTRRCAPRLRQRTDQAGRRFRAPGSPRR